MALAKLALDAIAAGEVFPEGGLVSAGRALEKRANKNLICLNKTKT